MTDVQQPAPRAGGIFRRLDMEWADLCADADVQEAVAAWMVADELADRVVAVADAQAGTIGPAQLLTALGPGGNRLTDAVLRSLLHRAAGGGQSATLAARIVVQAMIPAAVRITRGQVRPTGGRSFDDVGHLAVAGCFEVARSGRIHTRPGRPAANLALDTLRYVCAELAADGEVLAEDLAAADTLPDQGPGPARMAAAAVVRAAATAASLTPAQSPEPRIDGAHLELLELVLEAMDAGALSPADGRAIAWHYTGAVSDAEAAARTGTTAGAWQRRRSRAVARLTAAFRPRWAA